MRAQTVACSAHNVINSSRGILYAVTCEDQHWMLGSTKPGHWVGRQVFQAMHGHIDVVEMDTIWTAQFASAGWIEDLTDRITSDIKKDVPDSSLSAVTYQGKLYGMPWYNSAKHLFYNAKLLKDAGFDNPPTTLDEFVAQAKATTKPGQWRSVWCRVWPSLAET